MKARKTRFTSGLVAALALTSLAALGACAGDSAPEGPTKLRDDIPDPAPGGVQIVSPTFEIAAGTEVFMCMKIPFEINETMYVQRSNVYQMPNGHHTLLFYTESSAGIDPAPHPCGGGDMTDVRIVTTGAANGTGLSMPEGIVLKVPAGAELWAQSHYLNASDAPFTGQDVLNLELIAEKDVTQIASTFAHVDLTFALPPGQETTRTMECAVTQEMTIPWLLPHMHEWGKHFKIEIFKGTELAYDWEGDWFTGARNDFPVQELDEFITLQPGDRIRTTCTWDNTETTPLLFPQEMCVTFFPFYPGDGGLVACDETGRSFEP